MDVRWVVDPPSGHARHIRCGRRRTPGTRRRAAGTRRRCRGGRRRGSGLRRLSPRPRLERRADREGAREAVGLLVREGPRRRPHFRVAAVRVIGLGRALVAFVLVRDERTGGGAFHAGPATVGHPADDTRRRSARGCMPHAGVLTARCRGLADAACCRSGRPREQTGGSDMCCGIAILGILGPRALIFFWWLMDPARWSVTFGGEALLPALGFLFLPWTTIMYVAVLGGRRADPARLDLRPPWAADRPRHLWRRRRGEQGPDPDVLQVAPGA